MASALPKTADKTVYLMLPPVAMLVFFAAIGRLLAPSALPYWFVGTMLVRCLRITYVIPQQFAFPA